MRIFVFLFLFLISHNTDKEIIPTLFNGIQVCENEHKFHQLVLSDSLTTPIFLGFHGSDFAEFKFLNTDKKLHCEDTVFMEYNYISYDGNFWIDSIESNRYFDLFEKTIVYKYSNKSNATNDFTYFKKLLSNNYNEVDSRLKKGSIKQGEILIKKYKYLKSIELYENNFMFPILEINYTRVEFPKTKNKFEITITYRTIKEE